MIAAACKAVPALLAGVVKQGEGDAKRIAELEAENGRLVDSIARMGGSQPLETRLASNTREIERLRPQEAAPAATVARMLPKLAQSYRQLVANLAEELPDRDVPRARAELCRLFGGPISVRPAANGDFLEARVPNENRLLELAVANGSPMTKAVADSATASVICVVAGEGFEPSTFGL